MSDYLPRPTQLPPQMPHFTDRWYRWLCRALLRLGGWRLRDDMPDIARLVLIGVPHSSWWDGIWGLLMKCAIGANVHFMAKQEIFRGPFGKLLRTLGGMPIDRSADKGVVGQMVDAFKTRGALWLCITPEGTRRHVPQWKTGFWHIAHQAGVPILPVYFHYPDKVIGFGPPLWTSDDMQADIEKLRAFYVPFQGKHHGL